MAELVFIRNDEEVMRFPLAQGETKVGRGSRNDIVLPEGAESVASYHALVVVDPYGQVELRDLSGKGLMVNGRLERETSLEVGDRIEMGGMTAEVRADASPGGMRLERAGAPGTVAVEEDKVGHSTRGVGAILSSTRTGHRDEYAIGKAAVAIGSADDNDLVITDLRVSGYHARLFWRSGRLFVRDLGSTNGTAVNGARVVESEVPDGAQLTFGPVAHRVSYRTGDRPKTSNVESFHGMVGASPAMLEVFSSVGRFADADVPVLISGETGTGKELVAHALHQASGRKDRPFVPINCGAISDDLIESELFGHERGAFTGADRRHSGAFEQAGGGTLFLDEIGDIPLKQQVKFLRVLETGQFKRVGGREELISSARVVAASHRELPEEVQQGRFREDLLYRLGVLRIHIPPLRERIDDLQMLTNHFLKVLAPGRKAVITPPAMSALRDHHWHGNVRELKGVLQRALLTANGASLSPGDLTFTQPSLEDAREEASKSRSVRTLESVERDEILRALAVCNNVHSEAARVLGIGRSSLYSKMKRHGLS